MTSGPPRITLKSLDYFKYRKLIVDGNREDYSACDKEVRAACDDVQTLHFRDEEFDDSTDRARLAAIFSFYKRLIQARRLDATDVKVKSGWWGDQKSAYSAGKVKVQALKANLMEKAAHWSARQEFFTGAAGDGSASSNTADAIDGPGIYVFRHKDRQCFQEVCRADNVFARCAERLRAAFDGTSLTPDPLGVLLVITMATDWDFYYEPVDCAASDDVLRICENDVILKHDSVWPHGLNNNLHLGNIVAISEFRKSCLRHRWPPSDGDSIADVTIDVRKVKASLDAHNSALLKKSSTNHNRPEQDRSDDLISPTEDDEQEDSGVAAPPSAPISYASMPSVAMTTDELGSGSSGGVGGGPKGQGSRPAVTRKTPTPSSLGVRSSVQSPRPRSAPRPASAASKSVDHPTPSRGAGAGTAKPGAVNRGQGAKQKQSGAAENNCSASTSRPSSRRPSQSKSTTSAASSPSPVNNGGSGVPASPSRRSTSTPTAAASRAAAVGSGSRSGGSSGSSSRPGIPRPSSAKSQVQQVKRYTN